MHKSLSYLLPALLSVIPQISVQAAVPDLVLSPACTPLVRDIRRPVDWHERLGRLACRMHRESARAHAWEKALARTQARAGNRISLLEINGVEDPGHLASLKSLYDALKDKREKLQYFLLQMDDARKQLPGWFALVETNGANRSMEQQVRDTELLLDHSRELGEKDWLLRTPEELWADLERTGE